MDGSLLVGQVQTGTATDFAQIFRDHHGPLTNYLYHLLHSREVADDLAQETFLKAYRALHQTPPEIPFRAWLYRIATNTARTHQRRQRLRRWFSLGLLDQEPPADDRWQARIEARDAITLTLAQIGPTYASVLLLHHYHDLTLDETAAALGLSRNTTKVRLFRARKAFAAAYTALTGREEDPR
jgi:RNA polymerase sigma-70 factor (ECF subfamily)